MKSNQELLDESQFEVGGKYQIDSDITDLMAKAQVEAIKEVVKRYHECNLNQLFHGGKVKTVDDHALELIKEIES